MSPNMFSVTITSNSHGFRTNQSAVASTYAWSAVRSGCFAASASNNSRKYAKARNTFALSTQVTRPGPRPVRLRSAPSAKANLNSCSETSRVISSVSRASFSETSPHPCVWNKPSVLSRIKTKSTSHPSGRLRGVGWPGKIRTGRTPAKSFRAFRKSICGEISVPSG